MSANFLDAALIYHDLGWSFIPIRHRGKSGKQPALRSWKPYVMRLPTQQEVTEWFSREDMDGVAVICGPVSGNLVIRDFDRADAYQHWADAQPVLAKRCPTAKTARAFHVYVRTTRVTRILKCPNGTGELRGRGYCLAPPSRHPTGVIYEWIIPPEGDVPEVDPFASGLGVQATEQTEQSETTEQTEKLNSHCSDCSVAQNEEFIDAKVLEAIERTLPSGPGQRNHRLFDLARRLKAIAHIASADATSHRPIVRVWFDRALPKIRTKEFDETMADFVHAWNSIRFPAGTDPIAAIAARLELAEAPAWAIARYDCEVTRRIICVCRELQSLAANAPFFLSCRTAGQLARTNPRTAWSRMNLLVVDGVLKLVKPGTKTKAARYRYGGGANYEGRPH